MRKPLVLVVLVLAAVALCLAGETAAQKGPIKVGLLVPQTGPLAGNGKDMINGFELFFEQVGYKLAGREIKLVIEDDEGKPATGLTKARSLVEGQGMHVIVGPLSAAIGYAVAGYVDSKKMPTIFPIVSAEDITQRKRSPYVVRTGWSSAQPSHPFGKWVVDTLRYKKIAMIAYDFAFGWEVAAGFQRSFEEAGGQVVQKLWPPLGTADFGPYLAQLRRDVDAIYCVFSGADALRFGKQFTEAGLKARLPLIGGGTFTDEHVLRVQGDEVLGVVTALHYSAALATPANQKFVKAYEAKYKQIPSYYSEGTYVAGIALKAALEAIGGDIENAEKFLAALRRVDLSDAPRGPMKFDDFGNPVQNIYVRKVERKDGKLQNTIIHTFPSVGQFWTYKPDEYLKNPVYSRDYPPCKHC
ncbi:MAG: ABC transporter substrate-binding protein [Candidatus Rokubacteria bacterium]|nr:ABC transporter substrate-binding protein [Candidatus Rokubacteria bacterium]MBI2014682.1 ABC transporter substrate-binding protein [Candidatus Rokubacteria bacterium]MBI2157105.1 ABC transporter substrate-binding protein [Candidatus Rokubacteria bacterium]MBI2492601.1 ABC transporter substrate-binding protein [Candidatus Rokubacteria bacterium]MBI4255923.1 ABC transporter substrate-binding protein [Candidatus Rokubacteria bacterium]